MKHGYSEMAPYAYWIRIRYRYAPDPAGYVSDTGKKYPFFLKKKLNFEYVWDTRGYCRDTVGILSGYGGAKK